MHAACKHDLLCVVKTPIFEKISRTRSNKKTSNVMHEMDCRYDQSISLYQISSGERASVFKREIKKMDPFTGDSTSLWTNGPRPGAFYDPPGSCGTQMSATGATKRTLNPMVTGTSTLGMKFNGGVILAADMLGSYGSLARFRNISRVYKINNNTVLTGAGDYADFQFVTEILEQKIIDDECLNDGHSFTPKSIFSWLTRIMYNRRSKFNPLWNTMVVGGFNKGESFLGYVDKIGVAYESPHVACGYGAYIALPMMRDAYEKNSSMTEQEARAVIERCLKVLFYRDARSFNKYEIAVITEEGVTIDPPASSQTNWDIAPMVEGYE